MRAPSAIPDAPRPVIPPQWSMSQRHGRQICPRRAHTAAWAQRPISDDWVLVTKSICQRSVVGGLDVVHEREDALGLRVVERDQEHDHDQPQHVLELACEGDEHVRPERLEGAPLEPGALLVALLQMSASRAAATASHPAACCLSQSDASAARSWASPFPRGWSTRSRSRYRYRYR